MKDLFEGRVDPAVVQRLTTNEDNMNSLLQTEMTTNYASTDRLSNWLRAQTISIPAMPQPTLLHTQEVKTIIERIIAGMDEGQTDAQLLVDRIALHNNHNGSWTAYKHSLEQYEKESLPKRRLNANVESASMHVKAMQVSSREYESGYSSVSAPASNLRRSTAIYSHDRGPTFDAESERRALKRTKCDSEGPSSSATPTSDQGQIVCFLPGFKAGSSGSGLYGQCTICHRASVLAMVLGVQNILIAPIKAAIPVFLAAIKLDGILYKYICCDGWHSHRIHSDILAEPVSGALALLSIKDNIDFWINSLNRVFSGAHVDISLDQWTGYFGERLNELPHIDGESTEGKIFKDALAWVVQGLEEADDARGDDESRSFTMID